MFRYLHSLVVLPLQDIFSSLASQVEGVEGSVARLVLFVVGIIGFIYCAFSLRKYLAGDGRGDKEFVKLAVGIVLSVVLIAAGAAFFGHAE